MKSPDLLDIIKKWLEQHPTYNSVHCEKIVASSVTDGAILLLHRKNPNNWAPEAFVSGDAEKIKEAFSNYLMSISVKGQVWNHSSDPQLDEDIKPCDPNMFNHLTEILRLAYENR